MKIRVRAKAVLPAESVQVNPITVRVRNRPLRILDLDVEARPLHWIGGDYVSKEITAMAWAWTDRPDDVHCVLLGETSPTDMLAAFLDSYDQADMVTGHFIRGFDLPLINGTMIDYEMPPLGDKLAHDTKLDLVRRQGISVSQENLGALLRLEHPKVQMNQSKWRDANRLTPEGRQLARERVTGDVKQHIELRAKLLELNYLAPPQWWRCGSARTETYIP